MKGVFVTLATAVVLTVASAQVLRTPWERRFEFYPYAEVASHSRQARDINVDPKTGTVSGDYPVGSGKVFGTVQGDEGKFGYKQNIFDNENGKLDGSVYHGRTLGAADTSRTGGHLDWTDGRAVAAVDVNRYDNGPTSVVASGGAKWPLSKDIEASVQGTYGQTFGQGRPQVGVFGSITGRF